jgi:YVTN family beta-propeller protein
VTSIQYSTTQVGASALFVANAATLTLPTGSNPVATVFGTSEAYILNAGSGAICPNFSVIAIATNAVSNTLCIGSAPTYGVQTGNNVFILDKVLNQVNVYSTQQQKFIASIPVGTTPVFATLSFDGNFVYVVNQGSSDISIIDANALTVVSTVASGGSGPITAFLDRSLVRLYVLNQANTTVASFNALGNSTLVPLGAATVGPNPVNLTVLQGGNRAFSANFGNNTLTEINTGSFTTKTITIGTDPSALVTDVASSSDGSKLYAASVTSGNFINGVTVIRTSDEVVVNTLLAPKQDSNCVTTTASPCALQQPQQFLGGR